MLIDESLRMPKSHRAERSLHAEQTRSGKDDGGGRPEGFGRLGKELNGTGNAAMSVWISAVLRRMRRSVYLGEHKNDRNRQIPFRHVS